MKNQLNWITTGETKAELMADIQDIAERTDILLEKDPEFYFRIKNADDKDVLIKCSDLVSEPYITILSELDSKRIFGRFLNEEESPAFCRMSDGTWLRMAGLPANDFTAFGIQGRNLSAVSADTLSVVKRAIVRDGGATLIVRSENEEDKTIWSFHSKSYAYMDQRDLLKEVFDALEGEQYGVSYSLTNYLTDVRFSFPDKSFKLNIRGREKKVSPSIRFRTSDTGDSSATAFIEWTVDGIASPLSLSKAKEAIARQHRGTFDESVKAHFQNGIRSLIPKLSGYKAAIDELALVPLNKRYFEKIMTKWFSDIDLSSVLDDRRIVKLEEDLRKKFQKKKIKTAADLFLEIVVSPSEWTERLLTNDKAEKYGEAIAEIPYLKLPPKTAKKK